MALQLCRICGNKESLLDILEHGPAMLEKLSKCANIEIKFDDPLPKFICQPCDRMLDMSYQLLMQSETMQEKLQQKLKQHEDTEVHYISDDEATKSEFEMKLGNTTTTTHESHLDNEEEEAVTQSSTHIVREDFTTIDPEIFDNKTESTILASETENINEIEEAFKSTKQGDADIQQPFRSVSADDIESNDSYANRFVPINAPHQIMPDVNVVDDDIVDIGDMNDELLQDIQNTSTNSQNMSALEYCSVDLLSNPGSPIPDIEHEEFEFNSRSSSSPYTCVTCNETFARKKDYQDHIQQHGISRYQCIQCLAYFPTRYRLVRHEATHVFSVSHDCQYCKRQYANAFNLERHIKACHSKDSKYHCDICQVSYARQDVLKRHVLQIHTNKKWHCKACGESFRSAYYLNVHKSNPDCGNSLPGSKTTKLAYPIPLPLPPEYIVMVSDNRYKCIQCNALFKTPSTYRNHLLIHQDVRPFPCKTCPKTFRTRYAMISHERIHSNERPFKCDICAKSFRQVTHLKHHRYQHTKDDMPFNCTTCQMGFVTKWKLRDHLRKHYTEKAFKCAECPEEFFLKYDLKKHARLVHYRSVDIVDSDNEGNQKNQQDFTEGTTETDKTDEERNFELNETEDVINIIDDDDDYDYDAEENYAESSNSMQENVLVLNEAEPPSPGDVTEYSKEANSNLSETREELRYMEEAAAAQASMSINANIHSEDANEPQVHFINFDEDDAEHDMNRTNTIEKETIVDFIDLDEVIPSTNIKLNVDKSRSVANENCIDVIHLDEDEEEDNEVSLAAPALKEVAANEPVIADFMHYDNAVDESKPRILSSMIIKSANEEAINAPQVAAASSNEKFIDYIHLDSSNSCKSPPRHHFNKEYFDSTIVQEMQQEDFDTITEEKIQITEEKIETFTSFYNIGDMDQS